MEQLSLFDNRERTAPLASRLRPDNLDEYMGQQHLIGMPLSWNAGVFEGQALL